MSRSEDPIIAQEIEDLENRVRKLEQSITGGRESASDKNAGEQQNTYRVIKESGKHYVEFKSKEGWIRSDSSTFNLR
jgi:hypothetical protein|tara:strand:- start:1554 stop:1784 length:231 start_codon:yes stop_codon:yes gene_type:complete